MTFRPTKRDPLSSALPLSLLSHGSVRLLANTRLVVAALILLALLFKRAEQGFASGLPIIQVSLTIYFVYSLVLRFGLRTQTTDQEMQRWIPWVDLLFFGLILWLGNNAGDPIFFLGFLFVIVTTSWTFGRTAGVVVTAILCAMLTIAAMINEGVKLDLQMQLQFVSSALLFILGCAMAYLAESSLVLKRQAILLEEITTLSNPRLDVGRTIGSVMERVRAFYDAELCVLISTQAPLEESGYVLRRAVRTDPESAMQAEIAGPEIQKLLLALPPEHYVLYRPKGFRFFAGNDYCEVDVRDGIAKPISRDKSEKIADALDVNAYISIPVMRYERVTGRLYLGSKRSNAFDEKDALFLRQILARVLPVLQNVMLVDRLASEAAEQERVKIACDIHDSVIQPYLGIQLGLASIRERLKAAESDLAGDIDRLIELTESEVSNLRRFASGMPKVESEPVLLPAVRRFTAKFSAVTGISVGLNSTSELKLNDRLAVEVLQIVQEGLSNIRRHTSATKATVDMGIRKEYFTLRIANEACCTNESSSFYPRSIAARTAALGGTIQVDHAQNGTTAVVVVIPL